MQEIARFNANIRETVWKIILNLKTLDSDSVYCTYWEKTEIRINMGYIEESIAIKIFQILPSSNLVQLTTSLIITWID